MQDAYFANDIYEFASSEWEGKYPEPDAQESAEYEAIKSLAAIGIEKCKILEAVNAVFDKNSI
jgi:hypothetical protein